MSTKEPTQAQRYQAFEQKWLERCLWQLVEGRMIVELFTTKESRRTVVVVRHFESNVKRSKKWPEQIGTTVYLESDSQNTWDSLDKALEAYVQTSVLRPSA